MPIEDQVAPPLVEIEAQRPAVGVFVATTTKLGSSGAIATKSVVGTSATAILPEISVHIAPPVPDCMRALGAGAGGAGTTGDTPVTAYIVMPFTAKSTTSVPGASTANGIPAG